MVTGETFSLLDRLSAYDAEHVYEWLRMYWRGERSTRGRGAVRAPCKRLLELSRELC